MMGDSPRLELGAVRSRPFGSGQEYVYLEMDGGCFEDIFWPGEVSKAVVWLDGACGGLLGFSAFVACSWGAGPESTG